MPKELKFPCYDDDSGVVSSRNNQMIVCYIWETSAQDSNMHLYDQPNCELIH